MPSTASSVNQTRRPIFHRIVQAALSLICHAYFYTSALAASVIIGCLHLLLAPFDPHGKTAHTLTRLLSWHYIALNRGWQVEYQGLEHLDSATTFVIVANHQSLLDVLVLARLNAFYKWIAKKQISHLIGVAQLVRINQYIPVTHGEIASVRRMMRLSKKWLRRGVSVIIFPEGERTVSGALLEFKDGPFRLACSTSTPVLPVVICGTYDILPRGAWMINFGRKVSIKVLPPVHPESFDNDAHTLNCAVREMIAVELTRLTTTPGDASSVESPTCLTSSSIEPA